MLKKWTSISQQVMATGKLSKTSVYMVVAKKATQDLWPSDFRMQTSKQ